MMTFACSNEISMPITTLENETACIELAKLAIAQYPNIKSVIQPADYIKWERKLAEKGAKKYIFGGTILNLLTTSVITGWGLQNIEEQTTSHPKRLLTKLELYLDHFPSLQTDTSFKGKINNLEKFAFLSTISELSLAYYFQQAGFDIGFEYPFTNRSTSGRNDVDITITDKQGMQAHLEAYMPTAQTEINGFFDPKEGDHHYRYKIGKKLSDKFGQNGLDGLTGQVLLAVNSAFMDSIQIRNTVPQLSSAELYADINLALPTGVDGLLIFRDEFDSSDSFHIEGLYFKNKEK